MRGGAASCEHASLSDRFRGIVFDLDGTLVDSFDAITASVNHARGEFDLEPLRREEVLPHVGRGLEALLTDLVGAEHRPRAVRSFRAHYARVFADHTTLLPGVAPTVAALKRRGFRMSVASNKPARFGAAILEGLDLLHYLDDVQGPDLAGVTKPDPAMIRLCLASMGCHSDETVYVGDMPLDVESARRAGLAVVLVPSGAHPYASLAELAATVVEHFEDLLDLLGVPGVPVASGGSPGV